jgi:AcrR family transcriptional regulator
MAAPGLREQKKQATRRQIADVASAMFLVRGFDNVTVAEVAEAANVSKMTVFNYFPRKEDLYLDRHADLIAELRQAIVERQDGLSVVAAVRQYQQDLLAAGHPLSGAIEGVIPFWRVLHSSPALVSRTHEQAHEIQEALAQTLTEQTGEATRSRLVAGLLAAAVTTVFSTAVQRMLNGDSVLDVRRDQVRVINEAFDLLERGIGDWPQAAAGR